MTNHNEKRAEELAYLSSQINELKTLGCSNAVEVLKKRFHELKNSETFNIRNVEEK